MEGTLYVQMNEMGKRFKKPDPIQCSITLDECGYVIAKYMIARASSFNGYIEARMEQAKIKTIGAKGILIKGLASGMSSTMYKQEWWFEFEVGE